jgi:hypothetical protein
MQQRTVPSPRWSVELLDETRITAILQRGRMGARLGMARKATGDYPEDRLAASRRCEDASIARCRPGFCEQRLCIGTAGERAKLHGKTPRRRPCSGGCLDWHRWRDRRLWSSGRSSRRYGSRRLGLRLRLRLCRRLRGRYSRRRYLRCCGGYGGRRLRRLRCGWHGHFLFGLRAKRRRGGRRRLRAGRSNFGWRLCLNLSCRLFRGLWGWRL